MMPRIQTPGKSKNKQFILPKTTNLNEDKLDTLIHQCIDMGDIKSALFWSEKRIAIHINNNNGQPSFIEIAKYLKILYIAKEWQMILNYIEYRELQFRHLCFSFFYISALYNLENYQDIITLPLGHLKKWNNIPTMLPDPIVYVHAQRTTKMTDSDKNELDELLKTEFYESRLLLILAQTYLKMQNRSAASACIEYSIILNPLSCENVDFALKSHLMTVKLIKQRISEANVEDKSLLDVIYLILDYYNIENEKTFDQYKELESSLSTDLNIQTAKAHQLYSKGEINAAFEITEVIVDKYGYNDDVLLIYIGCLVEMKKTVELYELSHKLVTLSPDKEITWYAIGCYYYCAEQHQLARKNFYKCTTINPNFGYGWLAYGHSLSHDREHDQAMNCYLRASRLLENFAEPVLYIGLEYGYANSLKQASDSISDAIGFCAVPNPVILHEQGTVFLVDEKYDFACESFFKALIAITKINTIDPLKDLNILLNVVVDEYWVNLYFNLGVTLFELNKPCCAIACFKKVAEMGIDRDRAYMMMGFCYSKAGRPRLAIPMFQKSLELNPGEVAVKNSYEKAIGIVADLPSMVSSIDLSFDDVIKDKETIDTKKATDNRPNLGRFMIDASLNQSGKITVERTFRKLRGISDETDDISSSENIDKPKLRKTRMRSDEEVQRSLTNLNELNRPNTAPATVESVEEEMQIEQDFFEEDDISMSPDNRYDVPPKVLDLDTSAILNVMRSNHSRKRTGFKRQKDIGDPNELISDWFMEDIKNDDLRIPDDDLEILRPPPLVKKRLDDITEHPEPSDFSFLRTPIPRQRTRSNRRQQR